MSITFSTCFYIIHSKYPPAQYIEWIQNFISIVNQFNLVIYTDANTLKYIDIPEYNTKIKVILKPMKQLHNYLYKKYWIENHKKNDLLNEKSSWHLNMLWAEKIHFVKETIRQCYFDTEFYGWCDIGYFRNRAGEDTPISQLKKWPSPDKIHHLPKDKIVYGCVNNNNMEMSSLIQLIQQKTNAGLPIQPIPASQVSIAGGFFLLHKDKIDWWVSTFNQKLKLYFEHNYLVKDDQIILADCIFSNIEHFLLCREYTPPYDNWFMFQRLLS